MKYIDVHCHLNDPAFEVDLAAEAAKIAAADVAVICAGYDMESSYRAAEIAEKYPFAWFTCGFQPQEVNGYREGDIERLRALSKNKKCVAIGEIGLDYHYPDNPPKEFQKEILKAQLILADEEGLPVVLHSRDCAEDMLSFLRENAARLGHGGLLHCYSHSAELVKEFSALGLYFSFGGTATYTGSKKVVKSVAAVPLSRLLTETDSPYLAPQCKRGERNTPANIPLIVQRLAEIRGMGEAELIFSVRQNALRLFPRLSSGASPLAGRSTSAG